MKSFLNTLIFVISFLPFLSSAQTILIDNAHFQTGPYGINSDVVVPIKLSGCFNFGNRFQLYLSDQNGSFGSPKLIGEFIGFFTPFVNGVIPAGTSAGANYKIRVSSTNPNVTVETQSFSISASPGYRNNTNSFYAPDGVIMIAKDTVFGKCVNNKPSYTIDLISGSPGALKFQQLDSLFQEKSVANPTTSSPRILLEQGNYYTLISTNSNNNIISAKGYLVLASTTNLSLQTGGTNEICFPDTKIYSTNLTGNDGIQFNYPGSRYIISWGDRTVTDSLTHCQLVSNGGKFSHFYNKSSCGEPSITIGNNSVQYNAFKVNVEAKSDFCPSSFTPITTYAKVFERPKAIINGPQVACVNKTIIFYNNSKSGVAAPGNQQQCDSSKASYRWEIDGRPVSSAVRNLQYAFSAVGTYKIKLTVVNDPCEDATEHTICIEPVPIPKFLVNGKDSIAECSSGALQVITTNNTTVNPCNSYSWKWLVYNDSTGKLLTAPAEYTISPNNTDKEPIFNFTKPGRYRIEMQVTNTCGTFSDTHIVKVLNSGGGGSVSFPPNTGYCVSTKTIDFGNDAAHKPVYSINEPNETYSWSVAGPNTYSFQNSTSPTSKYPVILFNGYGSYTVTVQYSNKCGIQSASQQIVLSPPVLVDAGPSTISRCFSQDTLMLSGTVSPSSAVQWTTTGTGTFNPTNNLTTIYSISPADKLKGTITLKLDASAGGFCASANDMIQLTIFPENKAANSVDTICTGSKLNKILSSSVPGSSFSWTSAITTGSASGNSVTGTGNISDLLVNASSSQDAEITYTITPRANNCDGVPFTYKVIVQPVPDLNVAANPTLICSGSATNIQLSSTLAGALYKWTSAVTSGSATGNSSATNKIGPITDILKNTGTTDAKVTYTINSIGAKPGNCASLPKTIEITISAGLTNPNAGPDQVLCNVTSTQLSANDPSPATGTWTQVAGPNASIANPSLRNSQVSGLAENNTYKFLWTIQSGNSNCGSVADTVSISIRPTTSQADAGKDTSFCGSGNASYVLQGNTPQSWENGKWTIESTTINPAPIIINTTSPKAQLNNLKPGDIILKWTINSDAVGCSPTSDIVKITIGSEASKAVAGADQLVCNANTAQLNATPVSGTSSGKWTSLGNATIKDETNPGTQVENLVTGENKFVWTVTSSLCPISSIDTVMVTVTPVTTTAIAGNDSSFCGSGNSTYTLQGNAPQSYETGKWSIVSTNISPAPAISNVNNPTATLSNLKTGTIELKWEITSQSQGCNPTSDNVILTVGPATEPAIAGPDQQICNLQTTVLQATAVNTPSKGYWSLGLQSTATFADSSKANTSVANLPFGETVLIWTVTNALCGAKSDSIRITVYPALTNSITGAQTICAGQQATITGSSATGGIGIYSYQWQQSTDNILYTDVAGQTGSDATFSPVQNTWYRRLVKSLPCQSASDTILITVLPGITNNTISPSQTICINTIAANLIGSLPAGGGGSFKYSWQKSLDAGQTWQTIIGETNPDYNPGILDTTTWYRRMVSTQLCDGPQGAASNAIIITVNPDAKALFQPTTQSSCAPFSITPAIINHTIFADRNSSYYWYANGTLLGASATFPGYQLDKAGDSVPIKLVAISKFGCRNDSMQTWFYSPGNPQPSFTLSDTVGCGPLSVVIQNTTPGINDFNYIWDFGNGQTSNAQQPGAILFQPNPSYGDTTYILKLKANGGCDTIVASQTIRVKSPPKSLFTPSKVQGCSPMMVNFFNNSRGSNATFTWDFGDGTPTEPASPGNISHTFYTGILDTFFVKLYGSNDCGVDTQQYAIVVNPSSIRLNMAINGNQVNGCAPHTVSFVNNTIGANQFRWDFGDGSAIVTTTKGIDTVQHNFLQRGTYKVSVQATNSCSDTSMSINILVEDRPAVAFATSSTFLCVGQELSFTNSSDAGLAWNWQFGDGTGSSIQQPIKKYTAPGNYRVWLYGTKSYSIGFGCTDSSYADVVVTDTLSGSVRIDNTSSCAPMSVVFKNTTSVNATATWDFGDGATAIGDSVVHVFNDPGNYTVIMNAKDAGGCNYKVIKNITVKGPTGSLQYTGGFVCPGNANSFSAISNTASSYKFYFGNSDSLFTTNSTVSYAYKVPGTYLPTVMLSTAGCDRIIKGTDTIFVDAIKAGFRFNTNYSCGKTQIDFIDTSIVYFGIRQWEWSFGDGTYSALQHPKKTFTSPGNYTVSLKITSKSGCVMEASMLLPVEIKEIPVADFTADSSACTSHNVQLSAAVSSNDPTTNYSWTFGNGLTATGPNVSTTYFSIGNFTVRMIARSQFGCADTSFKSIKVLQSPVINAGPDKRICLGQSTTITATGGLSYSWSPLQGLNCTTCANPLAQPNTTTSYIVTGLNSVGCSNTDTVKVEVIQPLDVTVTSNDTLCIGQSSQLFASGADIYRWNPSVGLSSTTIPNPVARPASTTLYRVVGFDAYNCFTDTAYVTVAVGQYPTVDLGSGNLLVAGTSVQLAPNITNGPFKNYTWAPSSNLSCTNCPNPIAVINNNITYELKAENIYGCSGTDTISFQVMCSKDDQVYIPNAFSPDGDGINDVYMLYGKGIKVEYFRIYNRWGQVVFDGGSNYLPNLPQYGWDGKVNGKPATQDVYVYVAQVTCTAGGTFTYKGNLSLLILR